MTVSLVEILERRDVTRQRPRRAPRREKRLRGQRPDKAVEIRYRRGVESFAAKIIESTMAELVPLLQRTEHEYLRDGFAVDRYSNELTSVFKGLERELAQLDRLAAQLAESFVAGADQAHKKRFFEKLKKASSVDLEGLIQEEGLGDILAVKAQQNADLIVTIPEKYLARVKGLVYESTVTGRTSALSMRDQIFDLGEMSLKHAKFIARDQTAKLNAALTQERNLALGIEEYYWRTSEDERVRQTHIDHNGNRYRWDSPPANTGHPGEDYQCRCTAESIIPGR